MSKQTPILFSEPMVRAILDGRKTQTRRVVKNPPSGSTWKPTYDSLDGPLIVRFIHDIDKEYFINHDVKSPYGKAGDTLWVKETHYRYGAWLRDGTTPTGSQAWTFKPLSKEVLYCDTFTHTLAIGRAQGWHRRPSLFMPTWASRIKAAITSIRVERIQDISHADAIAEGVSGSTDMREQRLTIPQHLFADLWDSINYDRGYPWQLDPWVWVVEFKVISTAPPCGDK